MDRNTWTQHDTYNVQPFIPTFSHIHQQRLKDPSSPIPLNTPGDRSFRSLNLSWQFTFS